MTILIAEDTPASAIILRNIFEHAGHRVILTKDGAEALEALEDHPEIELVLSDVRMPEVDGLELISVIKQRPELAGLPVLMISGVSDAHTVRRAAELGCRGYILKPVNEPSRVIERVAAAMDGVPTLLADPDEAQACSGANAERLQALRRVFADLVEHALDANREGGSLAPDDAQRLDELARRFGARRFLAMREAGNDVTRELRALLRALDRPAA